MGPLCIWQTFNEATGLWGCGRGKEGPMGYPCKQDSSTPCYEEDEDA